VVRIYLSGVGDTDHQLAQKLVQNPPAQQLGVQDVVALLQAVVQGWVVAKARTRKAPWRAGRITTCLCSLPAAQQLTSADVLPLLRTTVAACKAEDDILRNMCRLPAAQQLTVSEVVGLLQADAAGADARCAGVLCALPAVQQLGSSAVQQLMHGLGAPP
jgi:hypothetical protein